MMYSSIFLYVLRMLLQSSLGASSSALQSSASETGRAESRNRSFKDFLILRLN
jgi:hypothetical protein